MAAFAIKWQSRVAAKEARYPAKPEIQLLPDQLPKKKKLKYANPCSKWRGVTGKDFTQENDTLTFTVLQSFKESCRDLAQRELTDAVRSQGRRGMRMKDTDTCISQGYMGKQRTVPTAWNVHQDTDGKSVFWDRKWWDETCLEMFTGLSLWVKR